MTTAGDSRTNGSLFKRYLGMFGPGYMQSAMTLGGGSAFAALFAGAAFGYRLLWVAPLAMLLGILVMASALSVAFRTFFVSFQPLIQN